MLVRESGFTFNGIHSRTDMGLYFSEGDRRKVTPQVKRVEYEVPGRDGTLWYGRQTLQPFTIDGTLYPVQEPATQAAAQTLIRSVTSWLVGAGRAQLILDYEPDKYYIAQVDDSCVWSLKNWFGGEIRITFLVQPYAWAVTPTTVDKYTTADQVAIDVTVQTGVPAPYTFTLWNLGTCVIKGLWLSNYFTIPSPGLSLGHGEMIVIDQGGMTVRRYDSSFVAYNAMPAVTYFGTIDEGCAMSSGTRNLTIYWDDASGSKSAHVQIQVRGRWL